MGYYSNIWLSAGVDQVPHLDTELAEETNKCLRSLVLPLIVKEIGVHILSFILLEGTRYCQLERKTDQYLKGETKSWDVGGDKFDPLDDAEELEIANL
ncbi:hypothetical protein AgCh_011687 [Apium graveolens]